MQKIESGKRIQIILPEEILKELDKRAKLRKVSRGFLVREYLTKYLSTFADDRQLSLPLK